ncbi:MAG TPA: hypothetical protein VLA58_08530 [Chitinophagaceae bacterium]|nr:hypothetical protein [Chitinophagaceae bacterium]
MRKFLLLCLLVPVIGMGQTKNVLSVQRMFAKVDKVLEFEKAIGAHAQKYHTNDARWRVWEITSGPDAGGYQVVEGGYGMAVRGLIEKMKKVWESDGTTVAVYMTSASGPAQYTMVTRYKNGYKDRDIVNPANFRERFEKVNGTGSFDEYLECSETKWTRAGVNYLK